jgi:hypothetical protein
MNVHDVPENPLPKLKVAGSNPVSRSKELNRPASNSLAFFIENMPRAFSIDCSTLIKLRPCGCFSTWDLVRRSVEEDRRYD